MTVQIIKTTMPDLCRKFAIDARFIIRNGSVILRKASVRDFDLPMLEETFKVLFDEDVVYVDKYKPEYKINYRKDDLVFNIMALVNNLNYELSKYNFYARLDFIFEKDIYITIHPSCKPDNRNKSIYDGNQELDTSFALVFVSITDLDFVKSYFAGLEDYEIEYHTRKKSPFFEFITANDIKQIPIIKEIISNNINEMKIML